MDTKTIRILLAGDFCPINRIEKLALARQLGHAFKDFESLFFSSDLNVVDLECPLTHSINKSMKTGPHQRAHPDTATILQHLNIRLVALANNHIMDYDNQGIRDTLNILQKNEINIVGVGSNVEKARKPFETQIKNKRIAIFNYADNEFLTTSDNSYTCNPIDSINLFYDISSARLSSDFIVVIIHGGNEHFALPSTRVQRICKYIIDIGADAIIMHHTHVYSGFEIYKAKPIFYGLGNFLYDWPKRTNSNWNYGFIVVLVLNKKVDFEIVPYKQCSEEPGLMALDETEVDVFQRRLNELNTVINNPESLEVEFQKQCKEVFHMYDSFIEPYFGRGIGYLRKMGLFPHLMTKRKRLYLLNLIRCESHREVLINTLNQEKKRTI